jgi:acetoin utilization deacetylase AcuC-like enzyme
MVAARIGLHHDPAHTAHDPGEHPETPARVEAILAHLAETGLDRRLVPIPARVAGEDDLLLVHEPRLLAFLRRVEAMGGAWIDMDTVVLPGSLEAAARAVGGALAAVDLVLDGALDGAFCVDRPPGHHATPVRAMGFCLYNQAAIAARHALRRRGLARVAIVDFDVHHGNGTQDAFYADGDVLYVSLHEYPYYPGTGHWRETGDGPGAGTTLNVALPAGCGDAEYLAACDRAVLPALRRFRPELVLVSAGFDAHLAEPLGNMAVTPAGYEGMTRRLVDAARELCAGRTVFLLEGGYRLAALARAVERCLRVLLGEPPIDPQPTGAVRSDVARLLDAIVALHGL